MTITRTSFCRWWSRHSRSLPERAAVAVDQPWLAKTELTDARLDPGAVAHDHEHQVIRGDQALRCAVHGLRRDRPHLRRKRAVVVFREIVSDDLRHRAGHVLTRLPAPRQCAGHPVLG